jgi:uncharacterized protein (TIRG00374 family)
MSTTLKRVIQLVVSLLIGGVCLWFAFKNVPIDETRAELEAVTWWGHAGFIGLIFVMFIVRTERWNLQVQGVAGRRVGFREALAINAVSFAAVFLFPFRLGELVRPVLSLRRGLMSRSAGIALSAVERVTDGLITTAFFGLVLVFLDNVSLPESVSIGGLMALALFGSASIVLVAAVRWHDASVRFWNALLTPIHAGLARALVGILERFLEGLRCFKNGRVLFSYVLLSVLFWALNGLSIYVLLKGMGVDATLFGAFFSLCFLVIGVMIPAPPGNLGNYHYFAKLSLILLGVAPAKALAFAVLTHGWQVLTLVVWGGLFLVTGDVSLQRLKQAALDDAGDATGPDAPRAP